MAENERIKYGLYNKDGSFKCWRMTKRIKNAKGEYDVLTAHSKKSEKDCRRVLEELTKNYYQEQEKNKHKVVSSDMPFKEFADNWYELNIKNADVSAKTKSDYKLFKYYLKEQGKTDREIKDIFNNLSEFDKTMELSFDFFTEKANDGNDSNTDNLLKAALKKWKNNVKFKGYNAKDSGAPEADRVKNGRANPDHIRYLYVSEDIETPIYEIRPKIGDDVSIARARLTRDAVIYDLTIPPKKPANSIFEEDLIHSIGSKFSQPISGNDAKYIPTQYLAEEIKKMGFDGIRYSSSVHKSGNNIVFFDPEICKMVSSDLYTINNINMDYDYHYLYQLGEHEESIENSIV